MVLDSNVHIFVCLAFATHVDSTFILLPICSFRLVAVIASKSALSDLILSDRVLGIRHHLTSINLLHTEHFLLQFFSSPRHLAEPPIRDQPAFQQAALHCGLGCSLCLRVELLGAIAFSYIHVYFRTWIDPVVTVRKRPAACLDNSHLSAVLLLSNDLLLEFILDELLAHEHFLLAHVLLSRNFRSTWLETTIDVIFSAFN